jgi:hypothetical protein
VSLGEITDFSEGHGAEKAEGVKDIDNRFDLGSASNEFV